VKDVCSPISRPGGLQGKPTPFPNARKPKSPSIGSNPSCPETRAPRELPPGRPTRVGIDLG
jgi:hypothetical protein